MSQYDVKVELAQKAGGAANQANISPSDIKNLYFPCPPIEIQNEIGKNIAYIRNKADDLYKEGDALLENAKQKIEKLIFE